MSNPLRTGPPRHVPRLPPHRSETKGMKVFLAGPNTQQQAEHCHGMDVLLSFAYSKADWLHKGYIQSFRSVLIDSGAYSELNTGKTIDLAAYRDWSHRWLGHADAVAGLDDIRGDWKRSLANFEAIPWGFPTWHETDPPELLPDLVAMARQRPGKWLGIGLLPPRHGKEKVVRWACDCIPPDIHVHGWALRAYTHVRRLDSVDSTNWWRDAMNYRTKFPWLNYGECLDIVVKRYQRWTRQVTESVDSAYVVLDEEQGE